MKKNIIIAILTITTIMSIIYAFYQETEAEKQKKLAMENQVLAIKQEHRAEQQMQLAAVNAMQAMQQVQIVNELLQECKKTR